MYVIDVIPLSRTAPGVLSYRSRTELAPGSVVDIMLRKHKTQGIVLASTSVTDAKEMLKHARFLLSRSLPSPSGTLPNAYMRAAERVAAYQGTTVGAVLAALFAEHVRAEVPLPIETLENGPGYSLEVFEQSVSGRLDAYAARIGACIVHEHATLLIVPTIAECAYWSRAFKAYQPLILTGALSGKKRTDALARAHTHKGLIIATPSFSWTPIQHLGLVIVDRISAGTYVFPKRPYIDVVRAVRELVQERAVPLIYGDFPLPLEYRQSEEGLEGLAPVQLFDARRDPDDQKVQGEPWRAVPAPVLEQITQELTQGGSVVVLATRTGYAPAVVCRDCGQTITDEAGLPLTFSIAKGARVFRSSDGRTVIDAKGIKCARCGSWNLLPLGVGQERVVEELRQSLPQTPVVSISPELLRTPSKLKEAIAEGSAPGSVLVGTEGLLPWLLALSNESSTGRLPLGVIASADSLLALPFWRSRERFVRLACFMRGMCSELVLITRRPEDTAVQTLIRPEDPSFFTEERDLRKALQYSPFGTIITLTMEGGTIALDALSDLIQQSLATWNPERLPDRLLSYAQARRTHVLMLPEGVWPDPLLSGRLETLPPSIRVRIDPESI